MVVLVEVCILDSLLLNLAKEMTVATQMALVAIQEAVAVEREEKVLGIQTKETRLLRVQAVLAWPMQ
jgi:hypothetical protein